MARGGFLRCKELLLQGLLVMRLDFRIHPDLRSRDILRSSPDCRLHLFRRQFDLFHMNIFPAGHDYLPVSMVLKCRQQILTVADNAKAVLACVLCHLLAPNARFFP